MVGNARRFLAVDDEPFLLEELRDALKQARPDAEILTFARPREALAAAETQAVDAAFLDIEMGSMTGLELAERLKRLQPDLHIIFVTGHQEYALQAFRVHATGYLLKPICQEDLNRELTFLYEKRQPGKIRVQTFGGFEIYVNGEPVKFGRSKSKELLAYLIDRRGASVTTGDAYAILFEDMKATASGKGYFRNVIRDMKESLKAVGADHILLRDFNRLAIVPELLDCDYYRFLQGDPAAVNQYRGDYLPQYSWAEFRNGELCQ